MICEECEYDDEKPIAKALEDIKAGERGKFELNRNGLMGLAHGHLKDLL